MVNTNTKNNGMLTRRQGGGLSVYLVFMYLVSMYVVSLYLVSVYLVYVNLVSDTVPVHLVSVYLCICTIARMAPAHRQIEVPAFCDL